MKKLEKLKLNHLSENALDERQQNVLKGGANCGCGCGACGCGSWDGSGSMPSGQHSSDSGSGSVTANLSGTVSHGI
ncbi:TIGR04149 family rSAM-modified RiPP [Parabacteroides sp. GYB001]|uniref:TIGR04149 family rSAM-modified RiPP n=1 Tax=Parabacteroides leei TaxID=2939491 RepID=UPI002017C784|nr:TIGR04149 family rSAM-modified RiPP [Parabacteroides leei]MCL3853733.1 TIGR04149 family rSAM-modified RiPP [Parabacteroides leei]